MFDPYATPWGGRKGNPPNAYNYCFGTFIVQTATGGVEPVAIGAAGSSYPMLSYNALPTATSHAYVRGIADIASVFVLGLDAVASNAFEWHYFATGAIGDALTLSTSSLYMWLTSTGSLNVANTAGSTVTLRKSSGASLALWPDNTGASNVCSVDNNGGTFRIYNNGGTPSFTVTQAGVLAFPFYANGTLSITGGVGTVSSSSDARLKNEILNDRPHPGLAEVRQLRSRRYTWKDQERFGFEVHFGYFSQEVGQWIPEAQGAPGSDGMYGLYDRPIIAASANAIRELADIVDELRTEVKALKKAG